MNNFAIVTDSCSDLSKELRDKYQIKYARMSIVKKQNDVDEEIFASLDWDLYTNKQLNDWLRDGVGLKTTQVSMEEFDRVFSEILQQGQDILYVACSSGLSGTYNLSLLVKNELLEKYPDRKIFCIDSLSSGMAEGCMAMDASVMRSQGATIEQVADYLENNKLCYHQYATVETLDYLKRAGRVKATTAFFGNILGIKPILYSALDGQNVALKKVKGRKKSLQEVVALCKDLILDAQNQTVYVSHGDCLSDAEYVRDLIVAEIAPKNVEIGYLGPIIGVSTGPGTVLVYVKGKKAVI